MNDRDKAPNWLLLDAMTIAKTLAELTSCINDLWRSTNAEHLQFEIMHARRLANRLSAELRSMAYHNSDQPKWDPDSPA
jgi:hypothetical protein